MSIEEVEKIGALILMAATKFLFAPAFSEYLGYNFSKSFFLTTSGGAVGILAFTYIGDWLVAGWRKSTTAVKGIFVRRDPNAVIPLPPKFTRTNRFIVRIKARFGLIGLALITPCLISIPIGTFVINRFYRKKWKILAALFGALLFWSLLLNGLAQALKLSQYLNFS